MKKMVKVVSVLLMGLFFVSACGNGESTKKSESTEKEVPEELTLYVVRHGKTMLNTTDRVQGWSDAVLTPAGEEVVTACGVGLKDISFQNAYSSDSGRAIQTADLIIKENKNTPDMKVITDPRLREFNFGTYEGDLNETMWQDIADDQGVTLEEFMKNMTPESFANSVAKLDKGRDEEGLNWPAEDYKTITTRLKEGLDEIVAKEMKNNDGSGNVLIASHGLSISALLDTISDDFKIPEGGLKNASVSIIKYKDGKYSLGEVNDLSYVEAGKKEATK
ncbi:histidine phosphatase family protein [Enterococcus sp. LJL99]